MTAFCTQAGLPRGAAAVMSFDRLHNSAFVREPDCELAVYANESCRRAGLAVPSVPAGWEASCDARLFAELFRDRDVVVFGPGQLRQAHGPDETVSLRDVAASFVFQIPDRGVDSGSGRLVVHQGSDQSA